MNGTMESLREGRQKERQQTKLDSSVRRSCEEGIIEKIVVQNVTGEGSALRQWRKRNIDSPHHRAVASMNAILMQLTVAVQFTPRRCRPMANINNLSSNSHHVARLPSSTHDRRLQFTILFLALFSWHILSGKSLAIRAGWDEGWWEETRRLAAVSDSDGEYIGRLKYYDASRNRRVNGRIVLSNPSVAVQFTRRAVPSTILMPFISLPRIPSTFLIRDILLDLVIVAYLEQQEHGYSRTDSVGGDTARAEGGRLCQIATENRALPRCPTIGRLKDVDKSEQQFSSQSMSPRRVYAHRPHSAEKHPACTDKENKRRNTYSNVLLASSGKGLSKVPEALEGFHLVISELPSSASSAEHSGFIVMDNEDWVSWSRYHGHAPFQECANIHCIAISYVHFSCHFGKRKMKIGAIQEAASWCRVLNATSKATLQLKTTQREGIKKTKHDTPKRPRLSS
ncbi:uncharacterized protein EV420DRAFT_1730986 [Desarmillaria tabescens]|uniref:Uncharacterized protein n=1 Tax=Armillaria tabescens TaxID=1929756 RepID=A0AA39JE24_ARMTA|nr:uncharacterized protein EV420DRAFT_1730986 [Desarmillaria tabescens]KAK0440699.1 hypothetical protein EV420DRAFT_1730986 [Desarmillaria tabescens]